MGRGKPKTTVLKAKKPKTEIQREREERRAKKALPRPAPLPPTQPAIPKEKTDVEPKPKTLSPGFTKWAALFRRELTVIETHIKYSERFRQHCRAEIDSMEEPERKKWESGEVGNYVRLLAMMDRSREILAMAREQNAWTVPPKKLGLNKGGLGMKGLVLGASAVDKTKAEGANGTVYPSSDEEPDFMDTDVEVEDKDSNDAAPADFIPLNISMKAPQTSKKNAAGKDEDKASKETVESNPCFMVDTNPTPVNLNGMSKAGKKRTKEDGDEEVKQVKKFKKENATVTAPKPEANSKSEPASASKPKPKSSKVDFSAIETQLQAEIEAGTKAKEERQKAKAEAKLSKKEKKRKRVSEGDSEKEVKKVKKDRKKEKMKRRAEDTGDEEVLSDDGSKKKHRVAA